MLPLSHRALPATDRTGGPEHPAPVPPRAVGDSVPDYGPGSGTFKVVAEEQAESCIFFVRIFPTRLKFMHKKEYPPFFEKAIPIALIIIGILVVALLVIILFVLINA